MLSNKFEHYATRIRKSAERLEKFQNLNAPQIIQAHEISILRRSLLALQDMSRETEAHLQKLEALLPPEVEGVALNFAEVEANVQALAGRTIFTTWDIRELMANLMNTGEAGTLQDAYRMVLDDLDDLTEEAENG